MAGWHNADEVQNILVGLALVASMPIAGLLDGLGSERRRRAGPQPGTGARFDPAQPADDADGPPLGRLHGERRLRRGPARAGGRGDGDVPRPLRPRPSLIGIGIRRAVGDAAVFGVARPRLKLINSVILLLLNYSNASVSLPQAVASPDPDFLAVTLAIVAGLVRPGLRRRLVHLPAFRMRPRPSGPR